ncbi:MAG: zf-TFIIB domain-containing protein [Halioglobus sp.]
MEYNADAHSIECPKCRHGMEEITYGDVTIDRCTNCGGLWFDEDEADRLKNKWMGDALDTGHAGEGKKWDTVEDISCPRCGKDMHKSADPEQTHIWYEVCDEHGMFMDAGEFTDYKHETLADWFRGLVKGRR